MPIVFSIFFIIFTRNLLNTTKHMETESMTKNVSYELTENEMAALVGGSAPVIDDGEVPL